MLGKPEIERKQDRAETRSITNVAWVAALLMDGFVLNTPTLVGKPIWWSRQ